MEEPHEFETVEDAFAPYYLLMEEARKLFMKGEIMAGLDVLDQLAHSLKMTVDINRAMLEQHIDRVNRDAKNN